MSKFLTKENNYLAIVKNVDNYQQITLRIDSAVIF